jgi:hypothetical protein
LTSISQQGLSPVSPLIPHINPLVFHATTGGRFGHPAGCDRTLQIRVFRPLVWAMKFVQIRWLSESGK